VIKKALTPGAQRITIPEDAILSPLAQDWLALKGIEIERRGA
jgi:ethanolamine utilization cobalamin adenosyltransferase